MITATAPPIRPMGVMVRTTLLRSASGLSFMPATTIRPTMAAITSIDPVRTPRCAKKLML